MHSPLLRWILRSSKLPGVNVTRRVALAILFATNGCAWPGGTSAADNPSERSTPRSVFLADLTSDELQAAVAGGFTTALVYSGSTEGSGPALALGKHNFRAPYYAERIARELGNTLVGQVVPFGVNGEPLAAYSGTIDLRPETFAALHEDIVRSLARAGFRRIVLLTEHGPNLPALEALTPRLDAALAPTGARVVLSTDNYTKSTDEIEAWGRERGVFAGRHGGLWDVSELWFIDMNKVRPGLLALGDTSAAPPDSVQVTGDSRQASAELGRQFADIRVRNAVAEIRKLLRELEVASEDSPYLLVSAGDADSADTDFLAVFDMRAGSPTFGEVISTMPTGMTNSLPHHTEYVLPPAGELLFVNAHHHEATLLVDVSSPKALRIAKTFQPPPPLRFPHDYTRTPTGTRLVGFLRSDGPSLDTTETETPGNYGGIAEYSARGDLMRTAMAGNAGGAPVRPYAFALLADIDRLVVTSAPMMETTWADVVQVYRYSDFRLLTTINLPPGKLATGQIADGSQRAGFGPRILPDGSVFFNSYGCTFYRLSDIGSSSPRLETFFALETPPPLPEPGSIRGSCGIPVVYGHYWINPVGQLHTVIVLDIRDPSNPREVFRLPTPDTFNPHWLSRDPRSNRLVLGAELGGEEGFYILRFDDRSGTLAFDSTFKSAGPIGYLSLSRQQWPHAESGPAWGHAALFLPSAK